MKRNELKKIIKKNKETIVATLLFFFWGILYFKTGKISSSDFLGIGGAIATIYFGLLKNRIEDDNIFKELFVSFNFRYSVEINDIFNELKNDSQRTLTPKEKNQIIDYFNLCAEEFLWFEKGRIPQKVWQAWKSGIIANIKIEEVKKIYHLETHSKEGRESYYGLVEELNIK